jgi:hypothetical protein
MRGYRVGDDRAVSHQTEFHQRVSQLLRLATDFRGIAYATLFEEA